VVAAARAMLMQRERTRDKLEAGLAL